MTTLPMAVCPFDDCKHTFQPLHDPQTLCPRCCRKIWPLQSARTHNARIANGTNKRGARAGNRPPAKKKQRAQPTTAQEACKRARELLREECDEIPYPHGGGDRYCGY